MPIISLQSDSFHLTEITDHSCGPTTVGKLTRFLMHSRPDNANVEQNALNKWFLVHAIFEFNLTKFPVRNCLSFASSNAVDKSYTIP